MAWQKRQGDLLIVKIDALPEGATDRKSRVLAEGERTGHSHTMDRGTTWSQGSKLYLRLEGGPAKLEHPEHGSVTVPEGTYEIHRQREFHDADHETRVVD